MSFESLLAKKTRSILSMLGIIIGVSTVIAVFAIGQGAQNAVNSQFQNLSANSIMIMSMRGRGAVGSSKLSVEDAKTILEKAYYVDKATAAIQGNSTIAYGSVSGSAAVIGVDENYFEVSNLNMAAGRLLNSDDADKRAKVAVLGSGAVETYFSDGTNPVGASITVGGKKFEVVGTLAEEGTGMGPMRMDDSVFVPNTTAESSIMGDRGQKMINVQAKSVEVVDLATEEVTTILREAHKLKSSAENDFQIMDAGSMVATAQESAKMMTVLLTAIAAITLLVSGIGIMNVMFVTVAERTKEIGIAKAIGGKQLDILTQFLYESIILSMIGGSIGIIIGQAAIYFITKFNLLSSITMASSLTGPIIGFSFSVLVGVFFGFYPAFKASRLDPVDALRSE